jgi:transposase-like protein
LLLDDAERETLEHWTQQTKSIQTLASRARIVLACTGSEVPAIVAVARRLSVAEETVRKWRRGFLAERLDGLVDKPRPGRPVSITVEQVRAVVIATLEELPAHATRWSLASMSQHSGLSKYAVGRIWKAFQLRPHLNERFTFPNDPLFIEKVYNVVGLGSAAAVARETRSSAPTPTRATSADKTAC